MATTCDINNKTPKIDYPSYWEYKVIIEKNKDIKRIVQEVFKGKEHTLKESKSSKEGKYLSYNIQTLVANEDERKIYFDLLKSHKMIKFVL